MLSGMMCDILFVWILINVMFLRVPIYKSNEEMFSKYKKQVCGMVEMGIQKVNSFIPRYVEKQSGKKNQ